MVGDPAVGGLVATAATWPGHTLKRHNDASHPIHTLAVLADFGVTADDPGMDEVVACVMEHRSDDGAFETMVHLPKAFGGPGEDRWAWMGCDAPTLLYALLGFGLGAEPSVRAAVEHLLRIGHGGGWGCSAASSLGRFKGPGRREDPCPLVCLIALKALSPVPEAHGHAAVLGAIDVLLGHWERRREQKYFLFAMGTDFRKLKYPYVWYDVLHVAEVLSRFRPAVADARFGEMLGVVTEQADDEGWYTAASMYRAWKGWSFANKKAPSPWLTFLVERIRRRAGADAAL